MRTPAEQLAIETAVRRQLQTEDGRDQIRQKMKAMTQGPRRRRLFELLIEAEIVHERG